MTTIRGGSKVDEVERVLRRELETSGRGLPSLRELSRALGVSRATVEAAARRLRDQGLLRFSRGHRPRAAQSDMALPENLLRGDAAERLASRIADRIGAAHYRAGEPLPKRAAFMEEFGVSDHTVSAARRLLERRGILVRRGRKWMVGSLPRRGVAPVDTPVILLVQRVEQSWRGMYRSERTGAFCRTFQDEASKLGVQILPVYSRRELSPTRNTPGGLEEIGRFARSLKDRYVGSLLAASTSEIPDIGQFALDLAALGKPVVWFDRYGEQVDFPSTMRNCIRCRFSEESAIHLALKHLSDMGHRAVGFPLMWRRSWRGARWDLLRQHAARHFGHMELVSNTPVNDLNDLDTTEKVAAAVDELYRRQSGFLDGVIGFLTGLKLFAGSESSPETESDRVTPDEVRTMVRILDDPKRQVRPYHKNLLRLSPLLLQFAERPDITALLAPSDQDALHIYYWLQAAGIAVPQSLSMLSFDNYPDLVPLPISTIDFGFDNLGYAAFHVMYGDVPVKRNGRGEVITRPKLVTRGSVARVAPPQPSSP